MTGYPHPKGPEHGMIYATPEDALAAAASGEAPVLEIPLDRFLERLNSPEVQKTLEAARQIDLGETMTPEQFAARRGSEVQE